MIELLEGTLPDFELLEARDFIRRGLGSSLDGDPEYAFKHAVTREVAYATVPKRRRARLHAAFAAWLEQKGGGRDEHAPLLAHHYASSVRRDEVDLAWRDEPEQAAGLREKAGQWLRRAGELAVARYDLDDGIALLRRAAEFEPDELERAELWREIGRANALGFRGAEFLDAMERSLQLSIDPGVRGATYAELAYQTSFRSGMWPKAPSPDDVSSWIEQALAFAETGTAARCKALIARGFWSASGDVAAAQEASAIAQALGDPDLRAAASAAESRGTYRAGRHADALALARTFSRVRRRAPRPRTGRRGVREPHSDPVDARPVRCGAPHLRAPRRGDAAADAASSRPWRGRQGRARRALCRLADDPRPQPPDRADGCEQPRYALRP